MLYILFIVCLFIINIILANKLKETQKKLDAVKIQIELFNLNVKFNKNYENKMN